MFQRLNTWLDGLFCNTDINKLLAVVATVLVFLWLFADAIVPLFAGILIAYLLESVVQRLQQLKLSRRNAVIITVSGAVALLVMFLYFLPQFILQLRGLASEMPGIASAAATISESVNHYLPLGVTIDESRLEKNMTELGASFGTFLLGNLPGLAINLFSFFLYMVLLPLLVFFLLKDKNILLQKVREFSPNSSIFGELWDNVDEQFGSYVRGKFIEAAFIGILSWMAFRFFNMDHALSLATLIGLSVFVPFVGAIVVTIPVVALAYIQFGWGADFLWIIGLYSLIQVFDGQVLVPLLFSTVVRLHPVTIFSAIIFFGNLWGFWGVFFAIPLASLIKAFVNVITVRYSV